MLFKPHCVSSFCCVSLGLCCRKLCRELDTGNNVCTWVSHHWLSI